MMDLELYETMTLKSRLTWETNHEDEVDEWAAKSGYEWREWEDTFSGIDAIEDILSDCARQYQNHDDYTRMNQTTISWQGKDVKCDLSEYDPRDITVPTLGLIWERGGEWLDLDPYYNSDIEALNEQYYDAQRARHVG